MNSVLTCCLDAGRSSLHNDKEDISWSASCGSILGIVYDNTETASSLCRHRVRGKQGIPQPCLIHPWRQIAVPNELSPSFPDESLVKIYEIDNASQVSRKNGLCSDLTHGVI
jgi:hypothetical protein